MTQAEQILRKSLDKIAAEQNYNDPEFNIKQVSTEGANYSSYLFEATISAKGRDELNLFAKVAASGEKMRDMAPGKIFLTEYLFYTELLQEYRQVEEKHGLQEEHRLKVPKAYDCTPTLYEETVVMENLSRKGYTLHNRFVSVDWEYAAASFTELAKFHALSIALKHEKPEYYAEFLKNVEFSLEGKDAIMQGFIEAAVKGAMENVKEENKGKLMAFMSKELGLESFMKFYKPGDRSVIRHGDFRPSNLLHKVKEDGSVDVVPVDFQMLVTGTPLVDLFYFIFLGSDKQFREQYFERLLDHYYSQLSAAVARLGMDPEEKYSRNNFDDEVKEAMPFGLSVALTTLALITVDSAHAPKVNEELVIEKFQDVKRNNIFAERLNGIVDDFIRWGIL